MFQDAPPCIAAVARAGDRDVVTAGIDDNAEPSFDLGEILPVGADQRGSGAVVVEVDDELSLGRNLHVAVRSAGRSKRG